MRLLFVKSVLRYCSILKAIQYRTISQYFVLLIYIEKPRAEGYKFTPQLQEEIRTARWQSCVGRVDELGPFEQTSRPRRLLCGA